MQEAIEKTEEQQRMDDAQERLQDKLTEDMQVMTFRMAEACNRLEAGEAMTSDDETACAFALVSQALLTALAMSRLQDGKVADS